MSVSVNIHEAKTHLSRLLEQALAGEDVIIMRSGKPFVKLMPAASVSRPGKVGGGKGDFVVPDNLNDTLPNEILDACGR